MAQCKAQLVCIHAHKYNLQLYMLTDILHIQAYTGYTVPGTVCVQYCAFIKFCKIHYIQYIYENKCIRTHLDTAVCVFLLSFKQTSVAINEGRGQETYESVWLWRLLIIPGIRESLCTLQGLCVVHPAGSFLSERVVQAATLSAVWYGTSFWCYVSSDTRVGYIPYISNDFIFNELYVFPE